MTVFLYDMVKLKNLHSCRTGTLANSDAKTMEKKSRRVDLARKGRPPHAHDQINDYRGTLRSQDRSKRLSLVPTPRASRRERVGSGDETNL